MDKPYFRMVFTPVLENPIFVEGLPGIGNVGKIAAHLLIKFCGAKLFAELYAPYFPDYVSVDSGGVCRLPKYEFYGAPMEKNDFIIMTGDTQPSFEDVVAHYELCGEILDFAIKHNSSLIITMGGVPQQIARRRFMLPPLRLGLPWSLWRRAPYFIAKEELRGPLGFCLEWQKNGVWMACALLGATTGFKADRGAGFSVFKFLMKALGNEVKEGL
jgi:proteasome assembly chaperone (PAC2) family protein